MQTYTRRKRPRGYTLTELIVTLAVVALIFAAVWPMLVHSRRQGYDPRASNHVRGIIQGCINFSPGNNEWYPGFTGRGEEDTTPLLPKGNAQYGTNVTGHHPAYRYAVMLQHSYFAPYYAINYADVNPTKAPIELQSGTPITSDHYSFAMLRTDNALGSGRTREWRATTNSKAVVVSDRNISPWAGSMAMSIQSASGGPNRWSGAVGYNDNHVVYETNNVLPTGYDRWDSPDKIESEVPADDLFADDKDSRGRDGYDAGMVYQNPWTYVRQW